MVAVNYGNEIVVRDEFNHWERRNADVFNVFKTATAELLQVSGDEDKIRNGGKMKNIAEALHAAR